MEKLPNRGDRMMKLLNNNRVATAVFLSTVLCAQFFALIFMPYMNGRPDVKINGHSHEKFAKVRELFRRNFVDGFERDGAAFAVYYRGEPVVDLYAGYAETSAKREWTRQTRTLLFSASKAISALCVAKLVDQGYLDWDDLVTKHWPEYGANGKENTTIQHVLSHQAGVPYIEDDLYYEDVSEMQSVLDKLSNATPIWEPGSASGYHALTFGFLVEGLVRRADPKGRTTSQFFKEEIAHKHDLDISIGVESYSDFLRSAVLTQPTALDFIRDTILDLRMLVMIGAYYAQPVNSILSLASKNPSFLQMHTDHIPFNSYEIQRLKLGAINGLSGAHDLARLFSLFLNGTIVSSRTLNQMTRPTIEDWHIERTVLYPIMKGFGFFYETHPIVPGKYIMGHPGYGCQSIHVDPEMDLVVAYLSNGLKSATSLLCAPYQRMLQEVYRSV